MPFVRVGLCVWIVGCTTRTAEDPTSWYDAGQNLDVNETVEFTDQNYDFPANDADGIADLIADAFPVNDSYGKAWAPGEGFPAGDCVAYTEDTLPREIEGVVTIHPRFYFKSDGCTPDSEEKYYGSFFIQDKTGGIFVLGDSKVAHFDTGNKVRLKVRAVETSYDLNRVYGYDVVSIDRTVHPIYFQPVTATLGNADIGKVRQAAGEVVTEPDTFGAFQILTDAGITVDVGLDSDVGNRGTVAAIGKRLQVTGPVLYSYDLFQIIVMEKGQIQELE